MGLAWASAFSLTAVPSFCHQCFETFLWCVLCGFVSTQHAGCVVNPSVFHVQKISLSCFFGKLSPSIFFLLYFWKFYNLSCSTSCKEIQPVHPKGDQSWEFIGRTDVEAETPILWPPDANSWLIWKDPDTGKDWGQEEKRTTEDEMVGWHHRLNGHEFGWTPGVGDGQGGLVLMGSQTSQTRLSDWTELNFLLSLISSLFSFYFPFLCWSCSNY